MIWNSEPKVLSSPIVNNQPNLILPLLQVEQLNHVYIYIYIYVHTHTHTHTHTWNEARTVTRSATTLRSFSFAANSSSNCKLSLLESIEYEKQEVTSYLAGDTWHLPRQLHRVSGRHMTLTFLFVRLFVASTASESGRLHISPATMLCAGADACALTWRSFCSAASTASPCTCQCTKG
jgi:hypothetical protein